ncbi:hypothetical protein [Tsukamurella soli]
MGGTSAVAPLWAGLVARLSQLGGEPVGPLHPALYAGAKPGAPDAYLRDITTGTNGTYTAGPAWDACGTRGATGGGAHADPRRRRDIARGQPNSASLGTTGAMASIQADGVPAGARTMLWCTPIAA